MAAAASDEIDSTVLSGLSSVSMNNEPTVNALMLADWTARPRAAAHCRDVFRRRVSAVSTAVTASWATWRSRRPYISVVVDRVGVPQRLGSHRQWHGGRSAVASINQSTIAVSHSPNLTVLDR